MSGARRKMGRVTKGATLTKLAKSAQREFDKTLDLVVTGCFDHTLPDSVYHYTKWEGFVGIVQTQRIWHTAHDCTNDKAELVSADQRIIQIASHLCDKASLPSVKRILRTFVERYEQTKMATQAKHYIASYSASGDNANQWQRYAADGQGVCLQIRMLTEAFVDEYGRNVRRAQHRVLYDEESWSSQVEAAFTKVIKAFVAHLNRYAFDADSAAHMSWAALSRISAFAAISVKQPSWRDEEEWRATALPGPSFELIPATRSSNGRAIRYVPLRIRSAPALISLKSIQLGAHAPNKLQDVVDVLRSCGYDGSELPEIVRSTTGP